MKQFAMTLCAAFLMSSAATAQKKTPGLDDLIPGGATYRFAENIYGLQWWGDVCIKPDIDTVYRVDPRTGEESPLFTRAALNSVLARTDIRGKKYTVSHLQRVSFPWSDKSRVLLQLNNLFVTYDFGAGEITNVLTIDEKASRTDYCAESGRVAYTLGNNLYVNDTAVTDEPEGVVCGQPVHREEFGIKKGTFWSPEGDLLAFYRMDERMVDCYPLVDISARIAAPDNIRYPMAGMTSHQVSVGIYNPATGQTVYLDTGDPTDRYFTNISWAPDGKSVYLIELNRDQNHAKLCCYDAETGGLASTLLEEKHPKYVEPRHPIVFLPWDADKFIYQSQRDGFNHLYLYTTDGRLIRQVTSGNWMVQDITGFDKKRKEILIVGTELSPLQSNLFRVNPSNGKRTLLGAAEGVHQGVPSLSGQYLADIYTAPGIPRNIDLIDTRSGKRVNLLTAANPFADVEMPEIETGTIKAADGVTDLHYRMVKPAGFDPNKKYPAIVYVYGGPHAQNVRGSFQYAARGWDIYMATRGYVMFTLDNRGSGNRGAEFENCTFRQLGVEEGKDQVKGAEYLKSLPFVDGGRIGVHGWSYGGHMTVALMLRYPDMFKAGVAGGPVIDWKYYEVMYGERYMDTPETNPEGYEATNLNNLAGNLKGRLLLIHDDMDDTCVLQHTFSFMKACVDARTYPDLFIYPGHKHNVAGRDRVHLHEKITRYFEEHL